MGSPGPAAKAAAGVGGTEGRTTPSAAVAPPPPPPPPPSTTTSSAGVKAAVANSGRSGGSSTPIPVAAAISFGGTATPKPAGAATPSKRASPMRSGAEAKGQSPAASAQADAARTAEGRGGGWSALQYCMRSGSSTLGRDLASETPTHPVCLFNPAVVLGDVTGSTDSSSRRVILDATASLVPYEGAAVAANGVGSGEGASTIWSVCVAATYGAKSTSLLGGAGGRSNAGLAGAGASDFVASSSGGGGGNARRGSLESAGLSGELLHGGRGGGGNTGGLNGRSADGALAGVRASMECGYPWGAAGAAQTSVPGSTMDAALRVARESPGLVLTWFTVPLPPNTIPRKEGTLYAEAASNRHADPASAYGADGVNSSFVSGSGSRGGGGGGGSSGADYVVIVVPLVCDSEVTTVLAHPFQPSTLLGGTRCGRVVQWAMGQAWAQVEPRRLVERAFATTGTATTLLLPPQRPTHSSFPSPQAHQAPVLRLAIHGDASCHHLYSISQEGKVCTWPAWQPLHPTASCLSYLGIRPMGNIGVAARFVERPGTDAMTQVFIGTTSGALLVGANRDAKSIELQYYGPPRPLPTSSTVIRTLDVTACPLSAAATAAAAATANASASAGGANSGEAPAASPNSASMDSSSIGLGARNPTSAFGGPGGSPGALHATRRPAPRSASPSSSFAPGTHQLSPQQQQQQLLASAAAAQSPQPHHGRIVSLSLQTAAHGFRGHDCVVSAASDGSCAAWFARTAVPLEGFSSAVTSVSWSPTKPGVLAAGDASGLVTLWAVNTSIITPVGTVSLREASRRTRGSAASDGVLWVVAGASDAAGLRGTGGFFFGGGPEEDDADVLDENGADGSLGQSDAVGAAVSAVFFSRDGRWLFASTACGYVYAMRVSASLA